MRHTLKKARQARGMTQRQVAEHLGIKERTYQNIEYAERNSKFEIWDKLEDLFGIHQRLLREVTPDKLVKGDAE